PPPPQPFSQLSQLLRPGLAEVAGPLRCDQERCTYETYSRACLDAHAKSHAGRRLYECDVCRMRLTNGANLRRHRMRHTGVKPYECRACSKRFFRRDHLLEHMSTHSKTASRRLPWQCPVCGKGFQRQIAMRAHYQNEHVREGEWSGSVCKLCGFSATCSQSLHAHLAAQHGLQLGSAPAPLLLPHHFLAPLELNAEAESPPGSPRPSQASPNSSQASPNSSQTAPNNWQAVPGAARSAGGAGGVQSAPAAAAIKAEPPDEELTAPEEADGPAATAGPRLARGGACQPPANGAAGEVSAETNCAVSPSSSSSRLRSLLQDRRPASRSSGVSSPSAARRSHLCTLCGILFPDQTLYFMHKGCHAENNPWKCNICSEVCHNVYEFNSHLLSQPHQ
ncbi:zinc finger protein ztf-16-like, partial [Pollicipes pollicipes]|uniref:zinc finger protein ztf-16-like n=1 Tax=Pollicipes pollicipes TaxID=41117 RepID=UPI001884C40E